jgi:hypothetical protein
MHQDCDWNNPAAAVQNNGDDNNENDGGVGCSNDDEMDLSHHPRARRKCRLIDGSIVVIA